MKKIIYFSLALLLSSCSGNKKEAGTDAQKLEELKKQDIELQKQIADLEKKSGTKDQNNTKVESVVVSEPKVGVFKHFLDIQGKVESDQNILVTSKAAGVITQVKVQRGDVVKAGQILINIDDQILYNSLDELKNGLDLATTVFNKQQKLWDQKIGTEIQYIQAKNTKESLEKKMKTLYTQIDMYRIKSPINGVVDDVFPKIGELASPGSPAVRVINFDKTKILAEVSESYVGKINPGDEVMVEFPNSSQKLKTSVRVVTKSISSTNRTFTVEINNPGTKNEVIPNMIAKISINDYTNKNAITVPLNTIQKDDKGAFVYVAQMKGKDLVAVKKQVKEGASYDGNTEILEGLSAEDKIVTSGYQNITEGQKLKY